MYVYVLELEMLMNFKTNIEISIKQIFKNKRKIISNKLIKSVYPRLTWKTCRNKLQL